MEPLMFEVRAEEGGLREFSEELAWRLGEDGTVYLPYPRRKPGTRTGVPEVTSILVALGSAGAFTVAYQIFAKFVDRYKDREICVERKGVKIKIKGGKLPAEGELVRRLLEIDGEEKRSSQAK